MDSNGLQDGGENKFLKTDGSGNLSFDDADLLFIIMLIIEF